MTKQLTQDVFKDAPDWVRSAAVDDDGQAWGYACKKADLQLEHDCHYSDNYCYTLIDDGYDTTNWQHSAIDIDKE